MGNVIPFYGSERCAGSDCRQEVSDGAVVVVRRRAGTRRKANSRDLCRQVIDSPNGPRHNRHKGIDNDHVIGEQSIARHIRIPAVK